MMSDFAHRGTRGGEMHKNGGIDRGKGRENPLKFVKI